MSAEKKRKAPDQQSAISRLRRARGAESQPSSREPSPPKQLRKATKTAPTNNVSSQQPPDRSKRREVVKSQTLDPTPTPEGNQFAALPYKQSWDGNRIYERISDTQLRVELAQGTGCVVLGNCTIWVKHGTVEILGANIAAGPIQWSLSAPNCAALPTIEARAGPAEIELGADQSAYDYQPLEKDYFQPPEGLADPANDLPFFVLGLNFQFNPAVPKQLPILNVHEDQLRSLKTKQGPAGPLVCGSRSSGTRTLARWLVNRALTTSPARAPVICVDLDPSLPMLSPVGAIGVSLVSRPLLGTQAARSSLQAPQVDRWHFVGPSNTLLQPSSWHQACIGDITTRIVELKKTHPQSSVVVLTAEPLVFDKSEHARSFSAKLNLTTVITVDRNGAANIDPTLHAMAEGLGVPIKSAPSLNENPHTGRQHQLSLQAYLGRQLDPLLGIDNLNLTYNKSDPQLLAVTLPQGNIPSHHLERVLPGLIAAIGIVKRQSAEAMSASLQRCSTSYIPILPSLSSFGIEPEAISCCVLGLVSKVEGDTGIFRMRVPLQETSILSRLEAGEKVVLVIQPPSRDGKFTVHSRA